MFDFQQLNVYNKAKSLHQSVLHLLSSQQLDKSMRDQLYRASLSIVLNIAEGSARYTKPDRRNFFIISRGSVFECVAIFDLLHDCEIIEKDEYRSLIECSDEISRILYTLARNLSENK